MKYAIFKEILPNLLISCNLIEERCGNKIWNHSCFSFPEDENGKHLFILMGDGTDMITYIDINQQAKIDGVETNVTDIEGNEINLIFYKLEAISPI